MSKRKLQVLLIGIVLIIAAFIAWYVFQQSNKLKEISQEKVLDNAVSENKVTRPKVFESVNETGDKGLEGQAENNTGLVNKTEQGNEKEIHAGDESFSSWVKEYIITPYFVQDLAKYVVSNYYPPKTANNKSSKGINNVNFKSINARYGLELTGLRHGNKSLEKARDEILQYVMDPETLQQVYDEHKEIFINEVVKCARNTKKVFIGKDGQREKKGLVCYHIKEMLSLNSAYLHDVAQIFEVIAKKRKTISQLIEEYLQAAQEAVHVNYLYNQAKNRYELLLQEQESKDTELDISQFQKKMDQARMHKNVTAQKYKQSIQKRESLRKELISKICQEGKNIDLENHEILYIAEWVHRRLKEGENSPAIRVASDVLDDLSKQFREKAEGLCQQS